MFRGDNDMMKNIFASFLAVAMLASLVTAAAAQATAPGKIVGTGAAAIITDSKGMTLYVYDKDAPGKSNCNGGCAAAWPPLTATAADKPSGSWTIVTRDDGTLMWAFNGKALYFWRSDKAPGDTTGDGVGGTWHTARPGAAPQAARPPSTPGPAPGSGSAY
jgi:predicted lipoprotein with Yx(FWY)xxD motif